MTRNSLHVFQLLAIALWAASAGPAVAQVSQTTATGTPPPADRPFGLFDRIFGGDEQRSAAPADPRTAQVTGTELVLRLDRLEAQIRQLTGLVEQLQYRNQQLEAQVRRSQEDTEYRFQELGAKGSSRPPAAARPAASAPAPAPAVAPAAPGRRGDVFDPAQNPNAPGSPRQLGSIQGEQQAAGGVPEIATDESPQAASPPAASPVPGGRFAGTPLDLSTLAGPLREQAVVPPGSIEQTPQRPARVPENPGTQVATLPPADTPRDQYDLAYGYVLRKDYGLAEEGFRAFLKKYPSDAHAPDAQYWLGESLYQRQRYRDAAESFLNVSTKYETNAKAPDALLRLGQSLAGLGEKEAACASLGEVLRKYPRASLAVKQGVEREQKRARC